MKEGDLLYVGCMSLDNFNDFFKKTGSNFSVYNLELFTKYNKNSMGFYEVGKTLMGKLGEFIGLKKFGADEKIPEESYILGEIVHPNNKSALSTFASNGLVCIKLNDDEKPLEFYLQKNNFLFMPYKHVLRPMTDKPLQ